MNNSIKYRKVNISESKELAAIHLKSFKDFFLSSLGKRFLNTYYTACLKSKETIVICAVDGNESLIGFSVGCIRSNGFHKRLIKQNFASFMLQGIVIFVSKPKAIIRLISNLGKNADKEDDGNHAELLSIGVLPNYKGQGIGKELIKRFEEEAIVRGCKDLALTTDFDQNNKVISFYKSTGYTIYNEFTTYPARKMYKFIKKL